MAKILLMILAFIIFTLVVLAMCYAMVVAKRSNNNGNSGENNEGNNVKMFWKRQICPKCKTGKYTYELDSKSEVCPYIGCWEKNKCPFYRPLDKASKKGVFGGLKNKRNSILVDGKESAYTPKQVVQDNVSRRKDK